MKRIILFFGIILLLTGCQDQTLTCTDTNTATNGLSNTTTYAIKYRNDVVRNVTITYHYNQGDVDGVNTGTDGTTTDTNPDRNGVVDGVVGDAIDEFSDGLLEISGIRSTYQNQITSYGNIPGFTSTVDIDNDNEYKVTYVIDLTRINDTNLATFNVDRSLATARANYEGLGLTCE